MGKVFITGGSGLLGSNIAKMAVQGFDVYASYNKNPVSMAGVHFLQVDLTRREQLEKIKEIKPEFIVHCAALTDIDQCEEHPDEAYDKNVVVSSNIADASEEIGAYLIHISTDCVFNGVKGEYKEDDIPDPINVYGRTKLEAERQILSGCLHSCIVRTNIYGWNKINKFSLAEWMLGKLEKGKELPGVKDVSFTPILVNDLARILFKLFEKSFEGVVHVAGKCPCSKLEFARRIAEVFGLEKSVIKPVSVSDLGLKALRGRNMSLDVSKIEGILSESMPSIEDGLREMKKLREEGYIEELRNA